jgi:hypothetical protein
MVSNAVGTPLGMGFSQGIGTTWFMGVIELDNRWPGVAGAGFEAADG